MNKVGSYDILDGKTKIGQLDLSMLDHFESSNYPGCPDKWNGKPVLEIDGLGIFAVSNDGGHGHGYGRFVLQECYRLAEKLSEGRMVVHAIWGQDLFMNIAVFKVKIKEKKESNTLNQLLKQ